MREREHREGRRAPPAAWAYAVAAVFWLGLPLAFTAYAVPRVWDYVKLLEEQTLDVEAPGSSTFHFEAPCACALYVLAPDDAPSIAAYGDGLRVVTARGEECVVVLYDDRGRPWPLQTSASTVTVSIGDVVWRRAAVFNVSQPGTYTLSVRPAGYAGTPRLLVADVGWPFTGLWDLLLVLLPLGFAALGGIVAGVCISVYVYVRRFDARHYADVRGAGSAGG